jgi:two-component system, OmpR family, copper resistance phosphate regulon response regulator CusR
MPGYEMEPVRSPVPPRGRVRVSMPVEATTRMSNPGMRATRQQRLATVIHTRPYPKAAIVRALMEEDFSVTEQPAGLEVLELILELAPNIIVVSVDPDEEPWPIGAGLTNTLRQRPTIALVPDEAHRVNRVLDEFATAYIRDSDVADAFAAQVRAFLRLEGTTDHEDEAPPVVVIGDLEVDLVRMRAAYAGISLDLAPTGTSILGYLVRKVGRIVSPTELLEQALHRSYKESDARVVARQYIRRIRRALEAAGAPPDVVVNVRGFGYMVEPGVSRR